MKGRQVVNAGGASRRERWVYGINAVRRRLEVQPQSVRELRLAPRATQRLTSVLARVGYHLPVHAADERTLQQLTGTSGHQGVAARTEPFRYHDLTHVLPASADLVLVLDQVQDPHNLGALVRTAAAVGATAVVIPRHGAAGVTPSVEKVAAGAVNDVAICQVVNVARTLVWLRREGFWSVGLLPRVDSNLFALTLPDRVAVVVGGEAGLRPLVQRSCDVLAAIPMTGKTESLNASVAGAVALFEVRRRRLDR